MAYNPNELVKCKHINELAALIAAKLEASGYDSDLPSAQVTSVKVGAGGAYPLTLVDDVFTGTVPVSAIDNKRMLKFNFTTAGGLVDKLFNARPPIFDTEQENTYVTNYSIQRAYGGSGQSPAMSLTIGDDAGQTPHTLVGSLIFPASPEFKKTEIKLSITFTE